MLTYLVSLELTHPVSDLRDLEDQGLQFGWVVHVLDDPHPPSRQAARAIPSNAPIGPLLISALYL